MALNYKEGERIPIDEHTAGELALHFSRPLEVMNEDNYEKKKKTSKTGRKIGAGGRHMTFAYDLLKPSDKRKYTKGGRVVSYNMNEVISFNSFNMLEEKKRKELLEYWINNEIVSKASLSKSWSMSQPKLIGIINSLGVQITNPKLLKRLETIKKVLSEITPEQRLSNNRKMSETKKRKNKAKDEKRIAELEAQEAEIRAQEEKRVQEAVKKAQEANAMLAVEIEKEIIQRVPVAPAQTELPLGMSFNLANRSGDECLRWANKILTFLNGDNSTYKISISVEEVKT